MILIFLINILHFLFAFLINKYLIRDNKNIPIFRCFFIRFYLGGK